MSRVVERSFVPLALGLTILAGGGPAAAQPAPSGAPPDAEEPPAEVTPPPAAPPDAPVPSTAPPPGPPPPPGAPPYGPWYGPGPPPPAGVLPPPPTPRPTSPEYSRRPVELIPAFGFAAPSCREGGPQPGICEGIGGGLGLAFTALWRVSPMFAWGGGLDVVGFQSDPPSELGHEDASAGGAFLGLLGRIYFLRTGGVDPFLELGIGGGALGTSARVALPTGENPRIEETVAGAAFHAGAGVDFFVSRGIKLGPALGFDKVFVDKVRRCRAGGSEDCVDLDPGEADHIDSFLRLNFALTFMIGEEY